MIYDRPAELAQLDTASSPLSRRLTVGETVCGCPRSVYSKRYFDALQAGVELDLMLYVPDHDVARAGQYVIYQGAVYRIIQAQNETDPDAGPCTALSLHREDEKYEFYRPEQPGDDPQDAGL